MHLNYLHRMHVPATYPLDAENKAPHILKTWLHYSPGSMPASRDFEDWAENAIMLHEAHKASSGHVVLLNPETNVRASGDATSYVPKKAGAPLGFMYGMWKSADTLDFPYNFDIIGSNEECVKSVSAYPKTVAFKKAARREFMVCDANQDDLDQALLRLHELGHRQVFIKTRFKGLAELLQMPEDPIDLWRNTTRDTSFDWFLVQYEGAKDILFIQEAFEPTKEYRCIIVGNQAVTGAGCIECFTPLDKQGSDFDTQLEELRNDGLPFHDPETTKAYLDFASTFAAEWAAEQGEHMVYSLDLAINKLNGEVTAIELNPFTNLGLYACKPERIMNGALIMAGPLLDNDDF